MDLWNVLGVIALVVCILMAYQLRRISLFFMILFGGGAVVLAGLVLIVLAAVLGADSLSLDFSNPPV